MTTPPTRPIDLQQPGPGHGRRLHWRRSERKAFGTIWPPGMMGTRGLAAAAGARAAPSTISTSSLPMALRHEPDRAVSCFPRRGTRPPRHRVAFERVASLCSGWNTSRTIVRVLDRRQGNRNRQGDARRADTRRDTHPIITAGSGADVPDIPEIESDWSGAAMPRSMPGTLLSESTRRMSSRTTRPSPKRATPGWRKLRRSRARRVQARSLTPALRVDPSRRRRRSDHGGG